MSSNLKKVRDIERMIKKFGASPEALAKLEEAKHGKEQSQKREKMKKNSTKYHMVKFLERKKLTRIIRGLEGKLKNVAEGSAEAAELNKRRDKNLNDLAYVMYYPIEHKYVALFPSNSPSAPADSDAEERDDEKSKLLSQKAREVALQRWAQDQQSIAEGAEGIFDKVVFAMEVEYKGGAAAAEGLPAKLIPAPQEKKRASAEEKATKKLSKTAATSVGKNNTGTATASLPKATTTAATSSDSSSSSSSGESDSEGSDSDSSDSDAPNAPAKAASSAPVEAASDSSSEDGDAFFMEEASESELPQSNSKHPQQPKVYNDGNNFRYKEERRSVHEIRFAATKRKYERHKRVFNNQTKRNSAQERKKPRSGAN